MPSKIRRQPTVFSGITALPEGCSPSSLLPLIHNDPVSYGLSTVVSFIRRGFRGPGKIPLSSPFRQRERLLPPDASASHHGLQHDNTGTRLPRRPDCIGTPRNDTGGNPSLISPSASLRASLFAKGERGNELPRQMLRPPFVASSMTTGDYPLTLAPQGARKLGTGLPHALTCVRNDT